MPNEPRQPRKWCGALSAAMIAGLLPATVFAADAPAPGPKKVIEEVIVTGSYIKGSAKDAALPVDVLTFQDLKDIGSPTITEMIKNLGAASGNLGETNQFDGRGDSGVSTINLRGLGGARTLVLLNGHRHVSVAQQGTDVSAFPTIALARFEVLKDGAAALYGSDAIAGVVNMITRRGFQGLEVHFDNEFIKESSGDRNYSAIGGFATERFDFMVASEHTHRSELNVKDRDWALLPFPKNTAGGWSGIGNPAVIFKLKKTTNASGIESSADIIGASPDPQCRALGGFQQNNPPLPPPAPAPATNIPAANACRFQYTFFDNLTEKENDYKTYAEMNYDLSDHAKLHVEGLFSRNEAPEWKTSPSYPPQALFGADRLIKANHPGLVDMRAQFSKDAAGNPVPLPSGLAIAAGTSGNVFVQSRVFGVSGGVDGGPQSGTRRTKTYRLGADLSGSLFSDQLNYDFSVNYSGRNRYIDGQDTFVENLAFALDGLGGPSCDRTAGAQVVANGAAPGPNSTPGVGPCMFYNPFSNAIRRSAVTGALNPHYNAAVANKKELIQWMTGSYAVHSFDQLLVWDGVFSGDTGIKLPGGNIGYAAGFQARNEKYDLHLNSTTDTKHKKCAFTDPASIVIGNVSATNFNCTGPGSTLGATGPFAFISGTNEAKTGRIVYGFFGELKLPIASSIDAQAAVRYESYGGEVGASVTPKLAVRWQATDWLALRGSAGTTFRGPPQSFLSNRTTSLQFIGPTSAFKAVDIIGNPTLNPEKAFASNVGVIVDLGSFFGSIDYWRFAFKDAFQTESFNQIVTAYVAQGCPNGGAGAATASCAALRGHVFPLGTTGAGINRIDTNIINGSDIVTSGIDFSAQYTMDSVYDGQLSFGVQGTYTLNYKSDDFVDINGAKLASGEDANGKLNVTNPFFPLPPVKGTAFLKYVHGSQHFTYEMHYTAKYEDQTPGSQYPSIDSFLTHDVHYNVTLFNDKAQVSLSVLNLADEDPPHTFTNLNYDPYTASPFGRMIKLGFTYNFTSK